MPYKDPKKRSQLAVEFHKKMYYQSIGFRFRKDTESEIQEALDEAVKDRCSKAAIYAKQATIEQLVRDGYLPSIYSANPDPD